MSENRSGIMPDSHLVRQHRTEATVQEGRPIEKGTDKASERGIREPARGSRPIRRRGHRQDPVVAETRLDQG